jgi:hypothetical protein
MRSDISPQDSITNAAQSASASMLANLIALVGAIELMINS